MIEENDIQKEKMRKEVKCDIKDITVNKKGKEDTNIGKNSKKTIEKLSKKEMKSDNNTAEQHSIHESISIRQRSRRQSEKMTPVKELDIKTENDSLKSDEFDNNQDSLPSPDSSFVRRSSRKRTDGLSVYKDFQLSNKKAAKSVEEDDAVCRSEENQSQVIDDVKVLNKSLNTRSSKTLTAGKDNKSTSKETKKEETKEKLNNKTSRPRIHNRNSKEAENCDIAGKSNDKKVITNCKNFDVMNTRKSMEKKSPSKEEPESDGSRSHNTRRRHLSLESNSSKISVSTAENEKSETPSRRSTRIRHSSRESDSSKTSFTTTEDVKKEAIESLSTRSTRKRHSSTESNASKMSNQGKKIKSENATSADKKDDKKDQHTSKKKSNSDQQLLEANKNLMEPLPRKRFSMDNKADETDLLKSDRHLRDRKSVENSEEMKQKDSNISKKKELSETYEGGKDTQNAFLDSFKQFVGISKPTSVSYPIKSLKQGKSSKLKSQANIHQRKQLRKVKEETNRVEQNAKGKMELGDLIEIQDFRKSNKNTSKDNKKVEVIDLTEDMESIDTKQQSMKEAGSSSNDKLNNSTSHKPSFLDSFLAHVNNDSKTFDGRNSSTKRKNDFSSNLDVKHMKTSSEKADNKIPESHNHDNKELKGSNKQHAKSEKAPVEQTKSTKEQTRSKGPEKAKTTSKNQQKEASRTKNIVSKRLTQNCDEKRNDKTSGVNDVETKQAIVEQKSKNSGEKQAVKEKNEKNKNRKGKSDSLKIEKKNKGTLCKSPGGESQFQNSFMSYIGSNSSARRDKLSQKKLPFKWELDDEETDSSKHSQMKTYEKKSGRYIESKPSKQPKSGECSESKSSSPLDKSTENLTVDKSTENSTVDESTESSKSPTVDKSAESRKSSKVDKNTESSKSSTVAKSTESSKSSTVTKSTESSKSSKVDKNTESSKSSKVNKSTESSKSSTVAKSTESSKSSTVAKSTESSKSSKVNKSTESSKSSTVAKSTESSKSSTVAKSTESSKSSYTKSSENVKSKESMDTNADSNTQISDKSECVNVCTNEKSEKQVQHKSDSLSKKQTSKPSRSSKSSNSKNNKNNTKSTRKKSAKPKSDKEYLDSKSKRTSPSSSNSSSGKSCAGKDSVEGKHTDTNFEIHFEKFVSTALNTDIDLEESESQKSDKESVKLDKGKKCGVNKGQKHFTELSSVVSKSGEKKIVKMETKSVSSTLDRGVASTTDSVKSRPAFRGFSSSAGHFLKNRIARYNLPSPPRKRYSSKAPFVVPKITTNKKLIPISEFSVVDSQEAKDKESSDSKSDTKSSSSTHHKLVPVDAHRIRHMYHGGKVWQIGQGSVSSTHLSSPTKRQQSNCQNNKALNIEEAKNTETMNVNDDGQKEVKSSEQGDEKDGEKHNRWKSEKRSAPTDDNVESKRTRSSPT